MNVEPTIAPVAAPVASAAPAKKEPEKRVKIIIQDSDEVAGDDANKRVFIGHNGDAFSIAVGIEADVPERILNVLNDAVISVPEKDPHTLRLTGRMRDKKRFSFSRV